MKLTRLAAAAVLVMGMAAATAQDATRRVIVVSLEDRKLALVEDGKVTKVYPVAVGKPSTPSPVGTFTIERRVANPVYHHDGKTVQPGPGNPVGTRWIGLSVRGYGIHGTNAPKSIGKAASHGCIRMAKADLEELFALVQARPGFGDNGVMGPYLQFMILSNWFGPSYQDNVGLGITVTYYDDPALAGATFGIDAWKYHLQAQEPIFAADSTKYITLTGTGKWREAYWEIDRIDFSGVNQAPQAAVRFKCSDRIHVSRIRYSAIRPCGPTVGQNLLQSYQVTSLNAKADTNGLTQLNWPYREPQLVLQGSTGIPGGWSVFKPTPILPEGEQAVVRLAPTNNMQFFRLFRPAIP